MKEAEQHIERLKKSEDERTYALAVPPREVAGKSEMEHASLSVGLARVTSMVGR